MSSFSAKAKKTVIITASILVMTGCSATYQFHGYAPSEDEMANVIIGADTRETVEEILGRPTSSGVLEDGSWFYVSSKVEHKTYKAPKIVERQLVVVSFDDKGVVENIERFGLEHGRIVTLSRRVTDLPVKGPSAIAQLLGNFGNFDLSQIAGEG